MLINGAQANKIYIAIDHMNFTKTIKEKIKSHLGTRIKQINHAFDDAFQDVYKDAWKMYDSFIDQFYAYETTSYIRHGETRSGTKVGINLYRANDISFNPRNFEVDINISSRDMEGSYKYDTPYRVLQNVLSGIRFKRDFGNGNGPFIMEWRGTYNGKYIHLNEEMTINEAFDYYVDHFGEMLSQAWHDRWR